MDKVLKVIGGSVLFSGAIILLIPLGALFGYFAGVILNFFVGGWIVDGLNLLLNTDRFTGDKIPVVCATLAVISQYFRTSISTKKD